MAGNAPAPAAVAAPQQHGWRVLVADDNFANQEVLRLILESRCTRLVMVSSGAEALEELREEAFDFALIDLEMPGFDGLAVARAVRAGEADCKSRGCRLLAVSAHRENERWAECAASGFAAFIEKPIDRTLLLQELNQHSS
jgi:CheY-like chemotaxis protein